MTNVMTAGRAVPARAGADIPRSCPARPWAGRRAAPCRAHLPVQAANPLLGRQEIRHEYDELQVGDQLSRQQATQKISTPRSARACEQLFAATSNPVRDAARHLAR